MIGNYLTENVTISKIAYDKWGSPTSTDTVVKGRFEQTTKLVRDLSGEQVVSSANVYLKSDINVEHIDKIKYDNKEYSILTIEVAKDFSDRFKRIYLK